MIFSWFRDRRRQRILAEPFPDGWLRILEDRLPHYARLPAADQQRLCDLLRFLIAEKNWEGCGGLQLTDEIRVTIAALACLLILRKGIDSYRRVMSILVYPGSYVAVESQFPLHELREVGAREGEAWVGGTVIVNWAKLSEELRDDPGSNLVLHEFSHQLDMRDGLADGIPILDNDQQYIEWRAVMSTEYAELIAAAQARQPTLLDKYGTKNQAEFFAVATECFFERPREMQEKHPPLYRVLGEYYQQNPAEWRIQSAAPWR
ncbi:MAG: zinc-dependent peptidase [Planctomycetia bacterium]|nr:zinc-dependent peptidase [Planctomycetia bacterium]